MCFSRHAGFGGFFVFFQKLPVIQHLPCNAVHQTVFDCVKEINVPACLSGLDLYFFKDSAFLS